jgi:hypothetical protein
VLMLQSCECVNTLTPFEEYNRKKVPLCKLEMSGNVFKEQRHIQCAANNVTGSLCYLAPD